jgi:DNA polymerase-3 subunit gamma/tau
MPGTVLYRKWRPTRFADIVGQEPIIRTLRNAIVQDKIAHAYLFSGPRGTGKTSTGRILAKAINVPHDTDGEPIGDSDEARSFDEGRALDLVEIDAASNRGIDNIRDLRDRANYVPNASRFKVYLIDEVHQLTDAAADALLKTLEEPPPHVVFILATTDPESLKATVLSRCQRFDFRRVSVADIGARLRVIAEAEGISIPDEALTLIAREATGSLRQSGEQRCRTRTQCRQASVAASACRVDEEPPRGIRPHRSGPGGRRRFGAIHPPSGGTPAARIAAAIGRD